MLIRTGCVLLTRKYFLIMNIQEVENKLAYKFVRGSTLYNTNIETSDVDYGGSIYPS